MANYIKVQLKVKGADDLARSFRALSAEVQDKVILQASRKVGKVVAQDFRNLTIPISSDEEHRSPASKKYGHAVDNIKVSKQRGRIAVSVHWGAAFWMFFREFGSRISGRQPARPLYRPFWDANVSRYTGLFNTEIGRSIAAFVKKNSKGAK